MLPDHCEKCLNDSNKLGPYDIQIFSKLKSINGAIKWDEFSQCKLWICDDCIAKIIRDQRVQDDKEGFGNYRKRTKSLLERIL